jgi:hypothetical protein
MKKVIRTIAAVAIMSATASGFANEPKLETNGVTKTLVFEWDTQLKETSLKFIDQDGYIVYSDYMVDVETYAKKFNLASLATGDYFLRVENTMKEVVYTISVTKNSINIIAKDEDLKPFYKKEEGMVYLSLLNLDKEKVRVTIFDAFGRPLFKENFEDKVLVEKVFNFNNAFEGEYNIVVKNEGKTYYETISVK